MPTIPNKRGGGRECARKRIQNNDSKDDSNLESKMKLQINRLETTTEKMQEIFNKDLEESLEITKRNNEDITKSQSMMNNTITEIKATLEGTNSRITKVEESKSEVEDRIVEINEAERKK